MRGYSTILPLVLSALGAALLVGLSHHHVFFWDTIQLASRQARWIYDNDLGTVLLPDRIDSGHPPGMGFYLAAIWQIFGRSLTVSHWAMWPWLWLLLYQLWRTCTLLAPGRGRGWLFALVVADPVLLGQAILVSPDIILLAAFLLGLGGILSGHRWVLVPAVLVLGLISMRGMLVGLGLYAVDLGYPTGRLPSLREALRRLPHYLPGGLLALAFLSYHYAAKGWIGHHPDSPWAPSFARVDAPGLIRNTAVLGWRWLDYGRVAIWLAGAAVLQRHRGPLSPTLRWLAGSWLLFALLLALPMLPYRGLMVHRYLLPAFILFTLLVGSLLLRPGALPPARRRLFPALLVGLLLLGNTWVYPRRVAQGWDATLAHWPYYHLRGQLLNFLEREGIALEEIGTAFPEIGPLDARDLSGRTAGMVEKHLDTQRYIFYSNVMNDFTDAELQTLDRDWHVLYRRGGWPVEVVLYAKEL